MALYNAAGEVVDERLSEWVTCPECGGQYKSHTQNAHQCAINERNRRRSAGMIGGAAGGGYELLSGSPVAAAAVGAPPSRQSLEPSAEIYELVGHVGVCRVFGRFFR